jgi:hypothetical protein
MIGMQTYEQFRLLGGPGNICEIGHGTVIYDANFVDLVTGVHTQGIEGFWSRVKRHLRSNNRTTGSLFLLSFPRQISQALSLNLTYTRPREDCIIPETHVNHKSIECCMKLQ